MRAVQHALVGVIAFVVAGFIYGGAMTSPGPELVLALSGAFAACGLVFVVAGGVAIGIRLARE